jgi:hypothetical protein
MLVRDKKAFSQGAVLLVSFLVVLAVMFMPLFGGENAFHASDRLFNTIAKGSTYYFPALLEKVEARKGHTFTVDVAMASEKVASDARKVLREGGAEVWQNGAQLKVSGDLGRLVEAALKDAEAMYYNNGQEVSERYGFNEREVLFAWWSFMKAAQKAFNEQEEFKLASFLEEPIAKGVEVGYNFYGISPEKAASRAGILSFALIFYVIYTLWWGYAIFLLCEGCGLEMKKAAKKEV